MQADSIIPDVNNPLSYDRYAYVNNNSVNFNDPSGYAQACSEGEIGGGGTTPGIPHPPPPEPPKTPRIVNLDDSVITNRHYKVGVKVGSGVQTESLIDYYSDNPNDPELGALSGNVIAYGIAAYDTVRRFNSLWHSYEGVSEDKNTWITFDATFRQNSTVILSGFEVNTIYEDVALPFVTVNNGDDKYINLLSNNRMTAGWGSTTSFQLTPNTFDSRKGVIVTFHFECYSCIDGKHGYYPKPISIPVFIPLPKKTP